MAVMTVGQYEKPKSAKEAYDLIESNKNAVILGGCGYLNLAPRHMEVAIDLSRAGLDQVIESRDEIDIGAMVNFRELEINDMLKANFGNLLSKSVENIVGVQFRNIATVGGTVYAKYGFSDLITALKVLDTRVVLTNQGEISLDEFIDLERKRDILEKIVIKKRDVRSSFQMMRNSIADYAILNCAVTREEEKIKVAVGARPGIAVYPEKAIAHLNQNGLDEKTVQKAAELAANELEFGKNGIGSAEYRKHICYALVKEAIMEVL